MTPTFSPESMAPGLAALAAQNILIGTSSWKYPGWMNQLYSKERYLWRGRLSQSRFNKTCLEEYARVFKTVCVDSSYYRFPSVRQLEGLAAQVPADFKFGFKVTDEVTLKRFTRLPRFGDRAGRENENFLNAELFQSGFLEPCRSIRDNVGLLVFEFSRFHRADYERGRDFMADLDGFLGSLPARWQYGVEVRNPGLLCDEYFAMLANHGVAHVYNSWQRMPPLAEQLLLPGSRTQPDFTGARLLLAPGRAYQEAVDRFSPYRGVQEPQDEVRAAAARLIAELARQERKRGSYLFVNNRLEGNALETIAAIVGLTGE